MYRDALDGYVRGIRRGLHGHGMKTFSSILIQEGRRATVYTLATFITQVAGFLAFPLFWQRLSPSDYGLIAVAELIGAVLCSFVGLSLEASVTRFYYEWPEAERQRQLGAIWVANWASILVLGTAAVATLSVTSRFIFPDIPFYPFVFLGLVSSVIAALLALPFATLRIQQRATLYAAVTTIGFVIQVSLALYLILRLNLGLYGYFAASIVGSAVNVLILGWVMLRSATLSISRTAVRDAASFSSPLILSNVVGVISNILDRAILLRFGSLATLGIYSISLKFTNPLFTFHSALKQSYVPFMVEAVSTDGSEGARNVARMSLVYVLAILMFGLAITSYTADVVRLANRPAYFPIVTWVPWLVWPAIVQTLGVYLAPGLFLAKRTRLMWIPTAVQLLVVIAAGATLIPPYQLLGVTISRYLSTIAFFVVSAGLAIRYYALPIPAGRLGRLLILGVVATPVLSLADVGSLGANIALKAVLLATTAALGVAVVGDMSLARMYVRVLALFGNTAAQSR